MSDSVKKQTSHAKLETEWCLLQNQYDSYEKFSLIIKLINCVIFTLAFLSSHLNIIAIALLAVVWLQDAIWKTFQARIENRLLVLEDALNNKEQNLTESASILPFQYNRQFMQNRPSTLGLVFEYFGQAIRPTIAFPHILLVCIATLVYLM